MTREEACQILAIEEPEGEAATEPICHEEIMNVSTGAVINTLLQRYDVLINKNSEENGGSFYVRSKIYFARMHLMQDWPEELNVSQYDEGAGGSEADAEDGAAQQKDEDAKTDSKDGKKDDEPKHPNRQ